MSHPPTQPIRVAIVGGGIVGLAFAIALAKSGADVAVDIYERAPAFVQAGAGIGFWPRIWESVRALGLADALRPFASCDVPARYVRADQQACVPLGQTPAALQSFHRADLLAVLLQHLPTHYRTHFGARLVGYSDNAAGAVTLRFKDGTTTTCDLLVGADGIKSAVRTVMYEGLAMRADTDDAKDGFLKNVTPTWTGQYVYRGLIRTEDLAKAAPGHRALTEPVYFLGKDKYFMCYPISRGTIINCAALVSYPEGNGTVHAEPWVETVSQDELRAHYAGWAPEVHALIDHISAPSKWAINTVAALPTYTHNRTALIGDAAHAMTPHQASGAAQGIEDARVLAALLASPHASRTALPRLLRAYDAARRAPSQDVLRRSFETGAAYCFQRGALAEGDGEAAFKAWKEAVGGLLAWTAVPGAQREVDAAVERFEVEDV
ncbi:FAD/NAD(P)-binding domain-containing protein [Phanerochaete sordida]|uniref:FAD/NAD(P)-binding domain-containing protein n=1 Tax=Phanerochaete sordida TaxID=48140 RepID=A0A9P3GKS7_9APHY|nr:FAD/NAD(P)-binding domain-containing protein [Phanerochaete sordida]